MDAWGYYYSLAEAYWIECQDAYAAAIKRYFTRQYEEDESLMEAFGQLRAVIGDTLDSSDIRGFEEDEDVSTEFVAYVDCEMCGGEGERWLESDHDDIPSPGWVPCDVCLRRRITDLEAQLERQINRALKWRRQAAYYKLREKRCMGEASYTSVERVDDLERQRDDLKNALIAIRDEADGKCWEWCNVWQLTVPAEFQVHGMPRFVAREALRRLEGEAASDESYSDSTTQG